MPYLVGPLPVGQREGHDRAGRVRFAVSRLAVERVRSTALPFSSPEDLIATSSSPAVPAAAAPSGTTAADTYRQRHDAFVTERDRAHSRWSLIANLRLVGFVAFAIVMWQVLFVRATAALWLLAAAVVLAVIALVLYHGRLRTERDRLHRLVDANTIASRRLALAWDQLPLPPDTGTDRQHAYAYDLNIIGRASLEQRIGTLATQRGWATLRSWLLAPASTEDIAGRQAAVAELAAEIDQRQRVEAAGHLPGDDSGIIADPTDLLAWAEGPIWLRTRSWLIVISWISPLAMIALVVAQISGLVSWPWWLVPVTINVILSQLIGARASDLVARVAPLHRSIAGYSDVFAAITSRDHQVPLLVRIHTALGDGPDGATTQIRKLTRASSLALPRGSMLYFPFQMAFLWDIHVLAGLERWQVQAGSHVRRWIEEAAEWEAVAALSVLAHDHPDWTYPVVTSTDDRFRAVALRHPLIDQADAVPNSVEVGPMGTLLFVTGSNMSGKSTLLRAVGVNSVLAQAGGPVAAAALSQPVVDIWTCMRVEDSLARGVSFFMAELQRLKAVVDAAKAATERPVLYLLDEILQGTNTAERQIASRQVLQQLARLQTIGAVSSHDLGLLDGDVLADVARSVHFAESFHRGPDGPDMTFDYTLRPGLATSTNALKLMELIGFEVDEPTPSPSPR
jgi:hypothetical protein